MKGKKSTRSAFLTSLMSLVLCFAMLLGTTLAWFTDTASTAVNRIQAGNLDVALEMKDGSDNWVDAEGKTLQFKVNGAIPAEGTQILWEPGCTYELPALRVVNKGDLDLKYKVVITGINGSAKLNEAIDWFINDVAIDSAQIKDEMLPANATQNAASNSIVIKGHMKEDAGNEYQGLSIDGIAITVYAAQATGEYDSFNNTYDQYAEYPLHIVPAVVEQKLAAVKDSSGVVTAYEYANSDNTFTVSVPADALTTAGTAPVVTAKKAETPANITIDAAQQDAISYDIKILNAGSMSDTDYATLTLEVGKGLTNVVLKHTANNGDDVPMAKVDTLDGVNQYTYDSDSGIVTFTIKSCSVFTVVTDAPAAIVNGVRYYDLQEALDVGGVVTLLKDVNVTNGIVISGKTIVLDLNGHAITYTGSETLGRGVLHVDNGANLTVKGNGKIDSGNNAYAAFTVYGAGDTAADTKLTIVDGTYIGYYYPISGNGTYHNTQITIQDGVFKSIAGLAVYHPQKGSLTINGGSFEGQESAIEIRSGDLTINGGTFTATSTPSASNPNGSGTTSEGAAIAVAQHTTKLPINVTINGGEFNAYTALYESNPQNNPAADIAKVCLNVTGGTFNTINNGTVAVHSVDCTGFITGGTFTSDPSAYVAANTTVRQEGNVYKVYNASMLISTADELFEFANSVNEKKTSYNGETVMLIADIDLKNEAWTPVGQTGATQFMGTFDGNDHTIKNMTVNNPSENEHVSSGFFGWIEDHGQGIVVKNVKFENASVTGSHYVGVVSGYLYGTIKNCEVKNSTVVGLNVNDEANGDKIGGIVGYVGEDAYVDDNKIVNCSITGNRDVGGIAGAVANGVDSFTNNSVSDTAITYITEKTYDSAGEIVSGRTGFAPDATNIATNVTITKK